ncbi:MAG TPA: hypothetical protein VK081_03955 [Planctomycetota bacterium]|nr:hypothetical protein [Planctomycetota bacterium]
MANRVVVFTVVAVAVVASAGAGLYWQQARAAAREREQLVSAAEVELGRDPQDRGALVRADRDLATRIEVDPHPDMLHARARIALALRTPDQALQLLDEAAFRGAAASVLAGTRARAHAMRHAIGGRIDDARQAIRAALDHFEATNEPASALLAWQCATRIGDSEEEAEIAERLAAAHPDSFESRVVQALRAFDPERPETGAALRDLRVEGPSIPEIEVAIAALDVLSDDEDAQARGFVAIRAVLAEVPASKPARLVAVMAHDRAGDVAGRNVHLRWLADSFPQDERAGQWRDLARQQ